MIRKSLASETLPAGENQIVGRLPGGTTVYAASITTGIRQLSTPDQYIERQTRFDRESRMSIQPGIVDDKLLETLYLSYVANQVVAWQPDEIQALKTIVESMFRQYHLFQKLQLPGEIHLVKTTGQEEGHAAYTRQLDTVVLPSNMVASLQTTLGHGDPLHPTTNTAYLEHIVMHETFHLFSKNAYLNDRSRLAGLYADVGYRFTGNEVALPDVAWPEACSEGRMPDFGITNPDSPRLNIYVEMATPDSPDDPVQLMPILMANAPYRGGAFFDYLIWYFMRIEETPTGTWRACLGTDGRPVLYPMSPASTPSLMSQYLKLIGYNLPPEEIFQADEVLAQNFVLLVTRNLPSQRLLADMAHHFQ